MHIAARARVFVASLRRLAQRQDIDGRQTLAVQRYRCQHCKISYAEQHADLAPGRWYARSVQRYAEA